MKHTCSSLPLLQFLLIILILSSCEKFAEGVVHEVPFPEHTPRLSATLIVNDEDQELVAMVTSSASVLDSDGPQFVQDAIVTLTEDNGQILYSLTQEDFSDEAYKLLLDDVFGDHDGELTVTVDAPGFEQITATNTMPSKPQFDFLFELNGDTINSPWGIYVQDAFTLNFENNVGAAKHYLIHVDALFTDEFTGDTLEWTPDYLEARPDPRITNHRMTGGLIVSDESLASNENALSEINFSAKSWGEKTENPPVSRRLRVVSLSPELANFYLTADAHLSGGPDFFAEPSLIYSNFSGGFGCFGLSSQTVIEID